MKNSLLALMSGLLICIPIWISAQNTYVINESSGKLVIHDVKRVTLVGTSDNKVTIEIEGDSLNSPKKAKGLKLISPSGIEDNTGIGLEVTKAGNTTTVRKVSNRKGKRYIFKVPASMLVHYEASGWDVGKLIIKDVKAELDVSVSYNHVELSGVTGPMAIHTVYGSIDAKFATISQEGPISLYSVYSSVDVAVPASAKADFKLKASYGDVYSDLDLEYPVNDEGMRNLSGKDMSAKANGGGVDFTLKSSYGNIYLRKK
ncbi:MAG: DUF4097 family beta strand repeat-containing protein [Bacteroidota bacterium]